MAEERAKIEAGTAIGPYVLEERVGAGGFGEVWTGRHREWTDRVCAFKFPVDARYLDRLRSEADVLRSLEHESIVRIEEVDTQCDTPYLRMEYVAGENLANRLAREEKLRPSETVRIVLALCRALVYAHDKGVLHRDIKPANVLLAKDGAAKLSDFGVALLSTGETPVLEGSLDTRAAQEGAQAGTLEYMAPELRRGAEPSAASDLYSLGVVLYRCLAGRLPRSLQPPSHFNPEVPPALDRLVARLLDPVEERYQSAAGVLADLEECLGGSQPVAMDTGPATAGPAASAEGEGAFPPRDDVLGWGELPYAVCVIALAAVAVNFRVVSPLLAISLVTGLFLITVGASKFSKAPLAAGVFWAGWAIVFLGPKRPMFLFVSIGVAAVIFGALLWLSQLVFRSRRPGA